MKDKKITLRELREEMGLSVVEVASKLKVSVRAIYNYENGIRQINLEQVLRLSALYECCAEEIIVAQLNSQCAQEGNQQKPRTARRF